jgi:hypothetical protein
MLPVRSQPVFDSGGHSVKNIEKLRDEGMFKLPEIYRKDSEGLIPVTEEYIILNIVDCPSLHLVDESALSPPRFLRSGDVSYSLNLFEYWKTDS